MDQLVWQEGGGHSELFPYLFGGYFSREAFWEKKKVNYFDTSQPTSRHKQSRYCIIWSNYIHSVFLAKRTWMNSPAAFPWTLAQPPHLKPTSAWRQGWGVQKENGKLVFHHLKQDIANWKRLMLLLITADPVLSKLSRFTFQLIKYWKGLTKHHSTSSTQVV